MFRLKYSTRLGDLRAPSSLSMKSFRRVRIGRERASKFTSSSAVAAEMRLSRLPTAAIRVFSATKCYTSAPWPQSLRTSGKCDLTSLPGRACSYTACIVGVDGRDVGVMWFQCQLRNSGPTNASAQRQALAGNGQFLSWFGSGNGGGLFGSSYIAIWRCECRNFMIATILCLPDNLAKIVLWVACFLFFEF